MIPHLYCFDNALDLEIWGNMRVTTARTLIVRLLRCTGDLCQSEDEIDNFINENGHLWMIYNNQVYQTQDYSDDVISKYIDGQYFPLSPNLKLMHALSLQQQSLTSEEMYAFGDIFPREETFYSLQKT